MMMMMIYIERGTYQFLSVPCELVADLIDLEFSNQNIK